MERMILDMGKTIAFVLLFLLCGMAFFTLLPSRDEIANVGMDDDKVLVEHKTDSVPLTSHFTTNDVTNYTMTNTWISKMRVETLHIGSIVIHLETGEVSIPEDMSISEASREFWKSVETMYPVLFTRGEL
jgi:hypothetical protein